MQFQEDIKAREARLVSGVIRKDSTTQYELYEYCAEYFWSNYMGVFVVDSEAAADILQETFVAFWMSVKNGRISVDNGVVIGRDGDALKCSIRTYFMGVARYKYFEWMRKRPVYVVTETDLGHAIDKNGNDMEDDSLLYGSFEEVKKDIIADALSSMSPQCCEILTKFYHEEKKLDEIMNELSAYASYDALKTRKHKCVETLRRAVNEKYQQYLKQ